VRGGDDVLPRVHAGPGAGADVGAAVPVVRLRAARIVTQRGAIAVIEIVRDVPRPAGLGLEREAILLRVGRGGREERDRERGADEEASVKRVHRTTSASPVTTSTDQTASPAS